MKKVLAIITMVHNEGPMLARWVRHYLNHVEHSNDLYVIDHECSDGSIEMYADGCSVHAIKRDPGMEGFNAWRASYVSKMVDDLLDDYEYVIYVDSDEFLVVDPDLSINLLDYCRSSLANNYIVSNYAIGFDVLHSREEPDLGENLVSLVRSKTQLVFSMCKPVLIKNKGITWSPGFHTSNQVPNFGHIYLFHLRYADLKEGMSKLSRTRLFARPEAKAAACDHQKISDDVYQSWLNTWLNYPVSPDSILDKDGSVISAIENIEFKHDSSSGLYSFDYSYRSPLIYLIPDKFQYRF